MKSYLFAGAALAAALALAPVANADDTLPDLDSVNAANGGAEALYHGKHVDAAAPVLDCLYDGHQNDAGALPDLGNFYAALDAAGN